MFAAFIWGVICMAMFYLLVRSFTYRYYVEYIPSETGPQYFVYETCCLSDRLVAAFNEKDAAIVLVEKLKTKPRRKIYQ